ncbi:MAG TPA: 50S ribosomal protein L6 [Candidatus Omnitrophica bacterium]|nr:50S ribosomal protein L6 [Candidatus Omnitrophota bacterium]
MSRVGKQPIILSKQVKANFKDRTIYIEGPKGRLELRLPYKIKVEIDNEKILVKRESGDKKTKSLHGTIRALINNMVKGITEGFKKELEIVGVGYKAQLKGQTLVLNLGFSHPIEVSIPKDLKVNLPSQTKIFIEGIDKQKVGEFAAQIRRIYPPDPYKGKGIRYAQEAVRRKLGKALAK